MNFLKNLGVVAFIAFLFGAFIEFMMRVSGSPEAAGPFLGAATLAIMGILCLGFCLLELFFVMYFWANKDRY